MTYPLRDPSAKLPSKRRPKDGEPFDPEDLSRRLTAYVSEQRLASQLRREARAAKERAAALAAGLSPIETTYHHIPTVAASAFQRTATPNLITPETVHKLAAPALKAALSPSNPDDCFDAPFGSVVPARKKSTRRPTMDLQRTLLQDREEVAREMASKRNPFQLTHALEEAAEVDELRDVYRMPVRTFGEFAHLRHASKAHARPLSTGDVFSDSEDTDTAPALPSGRLKSLRVKPGFEGRNDWAQEVVRSPCEKEEGKGGTWNGRVKERVSGQFLRKKESVWVLMGKKEKDKLKVDDSLVGTGIGDSGSGSGSSPPLGDGKKGFLARFKRTPSS
ncbi:hypothetical protein D0Z07_8207 [Hyphodiscus hymeniophilus]|uniref:Uncharacterized protein n=1 Tax=Hyphodiscus hymeniophilus TaxID=353542 RepID=A0A9P6SLQ4_9HELO|nr:hypothetical protein D0Z07_8207 [Hyphodiscus hymeniophilus]